MNNTAILVFARTPAAESLHKVVGIVSEKREILFEKLNNRIISLVKRTGLSFYVFDESRQRGDTFGKKLANAIEDVFMQGHGRTLVVGNDCPQITLKHLLQAATLLENNELVIGPDNRGGVFLVGINKASFNAREFENLHWQTSGLYSDLYRYKTSSVSLKRLSDINTTADLHYFSKILHFTSALWHICIDLLKNINAIYTSFRDCPTHSVAHINKPLRAPPAHLS